MYIKLWMLHVLIVEGILSGWFSVCDYWSIPAQLWTSMQLWAVFKHCVTL